MAVSHDHDKIADVLVQAGAGLQAGAGHDKIADVLVQAGADVNAANKVRHFPILRFLALHCDFG
jgi:prefoldin subunit 5